MPPQNQYDPNALKTPKILNQFKDMFIEGISIGLSVDYEDSCIYFESVDFHDTEKLKKVFSLYLRMISKAEELDVRIDTVDGSFSIDVEKFEEQDEKKMIKRGMDTDEIDEKQFETFKDFLKEIKI